MKERYKNIRKKFNQIIKEKYNLKEKRSRSFIEPNHNYIRREKDNNNNNDDFNITKNIFYKNEENNTNSILNTKFNILKKSLDKLSLIIEKNSNKENKYIDDAIKNIINIKYYYINELNNDSIRINNDLKLINREFNNKMKNKEANEFVEVDDLINNLTNESNNIINNSINKINFYSDNQQKYFDNINKDIKDQIKEINNDSNNDLIYSNQKYNLIMNDISSFNKKILLLDNEENNNRENFKKDINNILNYEIDNLNNNDYNEMFNSLELYKNGKKNLNFH